MWPPLRQVSASTKFRSGAGKGQPIQNSGELIKVTWSREAPQCRADLPSIERFRPERDLLQLE